MSIIPKISVGLPKKREKRNLMFDCSTTANLGNIQPTMCREMVPNEKYSVKVSSLVRLASMPLPTFGRISLRHHHVFVPYADLWQPFDSMLAGQHYHSSAQGSFVPSSVPFFHINESIIPFIVSYSDMTFYHSNDLGTPIKIDWVVDDQGEPDWQTMEGQASELAFAYDTCRRSTIFSGAAPDAKLFQFADYSDGEIDNKPYGHIFAGDMAVWWSMADLAAQGNPLWSFRRSANPDGRISASDGGVVTLEGADLITECNGYTIMFKFRPLLKRLRTVFIGLGWQFSPYNDVDMSVLKLLAYYKGWFSLFRPNREKSFVDTNCYKFIKYYSERNGGNVSQLAMWLDFLHDICNDCFYYLPMDYFSMAVVQPQQNPQDVDLTLSTNASQVASDGGPDWPVTSDEAIVESGTNQNYGNPVVHSQGSISPLALRLAQRLLTYANKNTVIGRSIRDYIKVHYGVQAVDPIDSGDVIRIGSSRVNINISDVMSTSENEQGYLGEYGGKGIGYGDSENFTYSTDKFGVWITYTLVVPESGYYQGYLLENRHLTRYQFFMPEFDALGYQVLERGEIMDDYNCDQSTMNWTPNGDYKRNGAFGFVPRYSEYKTGRNIVNGDLSLIGLYNSMSPYTLDRRISAGKVMPVGMTAAGSLKYQLQRPDFIPSVVYDDFRRMDPSDHLGQYNRIFNYGGNDLDHFIIHNIFDVKATAPMKSLTTSFDTYGEEDDTSINVTKA